MGDHLIAVDVAVGVGGWGRMADANLLTDLLILSRYMLSLARGSADMSSTKGVWGQGTLYSIRSI